MLYNTCQEEEQHQWTDEEILNVTNEREVNSRRLSGPYAETVPELTNPGILPALLRIASRCDSPLKQDRRLCVAVQ